MRRQILAFLAAIAIAVPLLITIHRVTRPPNSENTWLESLTSSYRLSINPSHPACNDPYALPGTLQVNSTHVHENRWIPFGGCEPPRLVEALLSGTDSEWARNRTVVVFGDSVARDNVAYFCEMFDARLERITWDHEFAPPRPSQTQPIATAPDPDADPDRAWTPKPTIGAGDQAHLAHFCRVERLGLLLVQQFHYGMDQEDYWAFKPGYIPPGTFEDRLLTLLHPIVATVTRALQPSTSPDLVMLNSALWDTARWVREDMRLGRDLDAGLTRDRLAWYVSRIQQAAQAVAELYPKASISWVTHHYPTANGPSDWFTSGIAQPPGTRARPGNTVLRLTEVDAAVRSAFPPAPCPDSDGACSIHRVRVNEWGRIMLGQEKHMKDALHQALVPGGRLWADMMLYDLWRTVEGGAGV